LRLSYVILRQAAKLAGTALPMIANLGSGKFPLAEKAT